MKKVEQQAVVGVFKGADGRRYGIHNGAYLPGYIVRSRLVYDLFLVTGPGLPDELVTTCASEAAAEALVQRMNAADAYSARQGMTGCGGKRGKQQRPRKSLEE